MLSKAGYAVLYECDGTRWEWCQTISEAEHFAAKLPLGVRNPPIIISAQEVKP